MWYVIFSQDVENSLERRLSVREKHLARLKELQEQGSPVGCGSNAGYRQRQSRAKLVSQAQLLLLSSTLWLMPKHGQDADPYIEAGVYDNVIVKPFKKVLP